MVKIVTSLGIASVILGLLSLALDMAASVTWFFALTTALLFMVGLLSLNNETDK